MSLFGHESHREDEDIDEETRREGLAAADGLLARDNIRNMPNVRSMADYHVDQARLKTRRLLT